MKDVPFAAVKMGLYEAITRLYVSISEERGFREKLSFPLSPSETSGIGFVSGALTGVLTCPLDCINTQLKSGHSPTKSVTGTAASMLRSEAGLASFFRGVVPRTAILGFGSTVFWYFYAVIQTYI